MAKYKIINKLNREDNGLFQYDLEITNNKDEVIETSVVNSSDETLVPDKEIKKFLTDYANTFDK